MSWLLKHVNSGRRSAGVILATDGASHRGHGHAIVCGRLSRIVAFGTCPAGNHVGDWVPSGGHLTPHLTTLALGSWITEVYHPDVAVLGLARTATVSRDRPPG